MFTASHLHPMIVHFPIALIVIGFLTELIGLFIKKEFFKTAAFYMLLIGALGAIAAYISGDLAGEGIEDGPLEAAMDLHEDAAAITLWLSIITALYSVVLTFFKYNKTWTMWLRLLLFTALTASVSYTGYLGGQLVYSHGAGIQLTVPTFQNNVKDND